MKWINYNNKNLLVNLKNMEVIDKTEYNGKHCILFCATSGNDYGWTFDTEEERDKVLKMIEEIAIDINIKI